ncbi:glycosyltransferase [Dyella marensis]|uniref:glycosyltransferase n=1 Tax=Dyella marensis TaxID=500610 RepID=UPI0031DC474E
MRTPATRDDIHVLVIPSWYPARPGDISGSFFREQALALHWHGCKVGVIYPQLRSLRHWRGPAGGERGLRREFDQGMPVLRSPGVNPFPLLHGAAAAWWVRHGLKLYRRYVAEFGRPDVVHAHAALYGGALARQIWLREGVPYVLTEHSSMYPRGRVSHTQARIAREAAREARRRFAVSASFGGFLEGYFGADAGSWEVMPNIVDASFGERPLGEPADGGDFTFLTVGGLNENKGIHLLFEAFARGFASEPGVRLRIGGHGPERARLEKLAAQLGIADRVAFLGALTRQQVAEELARVQALVHPSRYETFGVAIVEALAMGRPVVATRCGGPEGIVTARDGLLVPVDDIDALARAMHELRANIGHYDAAAIRQACLARFGEAAVVARLREIYEAAAGRKLPPAHDRVVVPLRKAVGQ